MSLKSIAATALVAAALSLSALAQDTSSGAPPAHRYQGWGLAISYEVIGEKCKGSLSADDMATVRAFVASGLADAKRTDAAFDHDKFARDFRADMTTKYADARNCTPEAVADARKTIALIRERDRAR